MQYLAGWINDLTRSIWFRNLYTNIYTFVGRVAEAQFDI